MTKRCRTCTEEKPFEEFPPRKTAKDGRRNDCRDCCNKSHKQWRESNSAHVKQYWKDWRAQQKRGYWRKDAATKNQAAAHRKLRRALIAGELKQEPCCVCGSGNTEAHHSDYLKPLDVLWMCRPHHSEWHRDNGEGLNK